MIMREATRTYSAYAPVVKVSKSLFPAGHGLGAGWQTSVDESEDLVANLACVSILLSSYLRDNAGELYS